MAKRVNITEKLSNNKNPILVIGEKEFEVKADAKTVLLAMGVAEEGENVKQVMKMCDLLLGEKAKEEILDMGIGFKDFTTIIEEAVDLATGNESNEGEAQTHTTI